jgi:hypothetical protein
MAGDLGRILIVLGVVAIAVGGLLLVAGRIPWLGRLPGDITIQRGPVTFYFPLVTCLVVSVVVTIVLGLLGKR